MFAIPSPILYASLLLSATVLMVVIARTAWLTSDEDHRVPFVAMTVAAGMWAFTDALQILVSDPATSHALAYVTFAGVVVVPGAWFLFAITYARNVDPTDPRYVTLLVIEPTLTLLLVATDQWHGLIYLSVDPVTIGGITVVETVPGAWYWVNLVYSYILVGLGILFLMQVAFSGDRLYRIQAGALVTGAIAPLSANVVFTFLITQVTVVDYTALAFAATAILFGTALYRFDLLQIGPVARDTIIEELSDPIVVLNDAEHVVDSNNAAHRLFEGLKNGDDIRPFLPDDPSKLARSEFRATVDDRRRTYVVRWRPLYGRNEDHAGSVLLFSDVTEVAEREQRLDVLNRVLRHNVRTDANIIQGYLELAGETYPDDIHIQHALDRVEELVDRSEKARRATETLHATAHEPRPVAVRPVVETLVKTLAERYPEASIDVDVADVDVKLPEVLLLETVLQNLVENAIEHTDMGATPWVGISTEVTANDVRISVTDSGPGLPESERAALAAERETQLTHSAGLGLWVVRWITSATGTTLEFGDRDPTGTVVTLGFDRVTSRNRVVDEP